MKEIFNELQVDVLKEYINVSFGAATASIATLLDSFATLNIPEIKVIKAENLEEYINSITNTERPKYLSQQVFNGELGGETVFIIDENSLLN